MQPAEVTISPTSLKQEVKNCCWNSVSVINWASVVYRNQVFHNNFNRKLKSWEYKVTGPDTEQLRWSVVDQFYYHHTNINLLIYFSPAINKTCHPCPPPPKKKRGELQQLENDQLKPSEGQTAVLQFNIWNQTFYNSNQWKESLLEISESIFLINLIIAPRITALNTSVLLWPRTFGLKFLSCATIKLFVIKQLVLISRNHLSAAPLLTCTGGL